METFDVHRRDILNFDSYMDLKKPGFGGLSSAKPLKDGSGKRVNKNPKLEGYQNTVERHELFSNPVYNPTYKAMSHDVVYKQEKKKPLEYGDPYLTGYPSVEVGKYKGPMNENHAFSFSEFINEGKKQHSHDEECNCKKDKKSSKKSKKVNESHFDDELERLSKMYSKDHESEDESDFESQFGANPSEENEHVDFSHEESDDENLDNEEDEFGSEDEHNFEEGSEGSEEAEEEAEEEEQDEWEKSEEEEVPEEIKEREPSKREIEEIERMLRNFEEGDEDDDEEEY